jgi:hypothetical protein
MIHQILLLYYRILLWEILVLDLVRLDISLGSTDD